MSVYFYSIIIVSAISQLIMMAIPNAEQETYKTALRFLCGLVMLSIISSPLQTFVNELQSGFPSIDEMFPAESAETTERNHHDVNADMWENVLRETASDWTSYLCAQYDIKAESISIVFVTDDSNYEMKQVQIFLKKCPYATRKTIEEDLIKRMEPLPVFVFGE